VLSPATPAWEASLGPASAQQLLLLLLLVLVVLLALAW
jgi:hypothetical protein